MRIIAFVQARMGSTRLPGKIMMPVDGVPLIELLTIRLSMSKELDDTVVVTSESPENDILVNYLSKIGVKAYRGSENNVLARYIDAAEHYNADAVVRITGDCPVIDSSLIDMCVAKYREGGFDYVSNVLPPTYPDGLDVEVVSTQSLKESYEVSKTKENIEHVTPYIRSTGKYSKYNIENSEDLSNLRWTVDEPSDLEVIRNIYAEFRPDRSFEWDKIFSIYKQQPAIFDGNRSIARNEGATMNTGQKLWRRAKRVIPGGNMLLSKRAEMFLPEHWPAYYSKAEGCKVWDLDGNEYIDVSIMGIGTNTLGYGNKEVDAAVREVVSNGNMSTFNCPEEVYLAESLIELHPWADMVRFARSGGEANSIAIRIARAASGKDKVAICGYHGWHDWYLSANIADDSSLDGHLLPGLDPKGVPRHLVGSVVPFEYNNIEQLKELIANNDIGVIKMEVQRSERPKKGFLEEVRRIATENSIVLVFDECTSGFRETNGGLHKLYGIEPDLAVFGKALGNGYAITSVIGRREVMEAAQSTFISSTFWTERIGPAAGLATLQVMQNMESWNIITQTGKEIRKRWLEIASKNDLTLEVFGIDALTGFNFVSENKLQYKTYITQEMLKRGYLAANTVYVCTEHTDDVVDEYFQNLEEVFVEIAEFENGRDISDLLNGPVCHSGFKRLN